MKTTRIAIAFALLLVAGSARAESSIPGGNYVDDFGPLTTSTATPSAVPSSALARSAVVPNWVDDFGPLVADEEELGAAGGEPGVDANIAERAAPQASPENERFLQEVWTLP